MPPAWQKRQMEQQQLIQELDGELMAHAENDGEAFFIEFEVALLMSLLPDSNSYRQVRFQGSTKAYEQYYRMLDRIEAFARVASEVPYLLGQLFETTHKHVRPELDAQYQRAQMAEPRRCFGTDSATAEVEL